ncbi:hypothetical protein [Flavobacterium sp. '19STA2R22 D10 B1']|uniref:hypothetical protein n=1 Tax=Flavobacterium aerium TaxID=3037261 RepID=UPI00278C51E3|nr:hypothetical protein [Flavobacterium sp. '19STA2R22 D10 B1']
MNKKLKEETLLKNAMIKKVQFDTEWYYDLKDVYDYLNEDLSAVEFIHLPFLVEEERVNTKCATLEDIERGRKIEPNKISIKKK